MGNVWGNKIKLSIFGESHGAAIGIVIDGLPAGFEIDENAVNTEMARRAPGQSDISTPRRETDKWEIVSGFFNGKTTGSPLCVIIRNENTRSGDYTPHLMRPSHADFTALHKYKGFADYRGGGHFSGRLTAPIVFAGAIAKQILRTQGVEIKSSIVQIHSAKNPSPEIMREIVLKAKADGDSVGGVIECVATGIPIGCGDPFFESVESIISSLMFSIPAVKGVEFGDGFGLAEMYGSEANDQMYAEAGKVLFKSNHNGGINGGITNGQPVICRVAVKPTPTISKEQTTVDVLKNETVSVKFGGRHDPCIVPRAVPVVEAAMALGLLELLSNQ